jgi:hypothetical protein
VAFPPLLAFGAGLWLVDAAALEAFGFLACKRKKNRINFYRFSFSENGLIKKESFIM